MSHEFVIGGFRKEPAWHKLGIVREDGWPDLRTALVDTGIADCDIRLLPLTYTLPDGTVKESNQRILVRAPLTAAGLAEWEEFEAVSSDYEVITPYQIGEVLNPLSTPDRWPVDTLGLLGTGKRKGERLFLCLKMETSVPLGDEGEAHDHYLFVSNDHRGNGALTVMVTSVRVVCANTWAMAFGSKHSKKMSVPHTGDALKMLEFRTGLEVAAIEGRKAAVAEFEFLMKAKMVKAELQQVIEAAFRVPDVPEMVTMMAAQETQSLDFRPELLEWATSRAARAQYNWENSRARAFERRERATDLLLKFNDEFPAYANTAYAVLNAVNEDCDWRKGRGDTDFQVLYGERAIEKDRAYAAVSELVHLN